MWKSNGSEAGTARVADIHPTKSSSPSALAAAGGVVFFRADDGVHGRELWVSDGTEAGTRLVADLQPGGLSSFPDQLTPGEALLFFTASEAAHGWELWALSLAVIPDTVGGRIYLPVIFRRP